jgi:cell division protein FtsQ
MTRGALNRKNGRVHGAAVSAPPEDFASGESPLPGAVGARQKPRGFGAKLLAAIRLGAGLAVVVGAAAGVAIGVHRYALSTPRFALTTLELSGQKRLTPGDIERLGGLTKGKNLFALDTEAAERKILDDPWVKSVRLTRELPGTLRVELGEREAAAVAVVGDQLYLVTPEGEPFKQVAKGDPVDLPVLTGVAPEMLARDRARALERLQGALELIRDYERVPSSRVQPIEEVHLSPSGDVSVTVGRDGVTLELGQPPYARKLSMAEQVLSKLRRKGKTPGIVFLDNQAHPERVVVRMK